ncbi:SubName: Full=Related to 40S ribosomal protein S18-Coprinopsis cinerea {ECO:0000313/EMBL:CCA74180.1} [Serendipita indica DSM 11827]|uniref:Related to 40S ribosomal protein S18-Coprinopsis cinerea n=1 Tax=Serendipita indica (strain DSM 11827) TaxID=1109443 RepID=G4TS87_SERID|nr:SubName: Full=Related to 40S ribosomal protein S18-Coprinopsis cinerea {ECO:0000313/EMBL:CCA74180.1} [Serendipita indica DSM 11827]CCA74180.1 related to 40S ribosomal protein S18-Coprinopsis cinerea [Serendipita indica DSM 11827]
MSYAAVAAHNAPPPSQQPHPDLGLLNTARPTDQVIPDVDTGKVNVVSHDFKQHPVTDTTLHVEHSSSSEDEGHTPDTHKRKSRKDKQRKRKARHAERKFEGWIDWTKDKLFQPAVAGGFFAVVNLGVLGTVGYHVYKRPTLVTEPRMNARPLSYIGAGLFSLFTLESLAADAYLRTAKGQQELRRAEEEGHYLYNKTKEVVLRPKVAGGLLGVANLAVLSALGYGAYTHWDSHIDKKNISYVTIGLITWFSAQGWAVEKYLQEDIPRRY